MRLGFALENTKVFLVSGDNKKELTKDTLVEVCQLLLGHLSPNRDYTSITSVNKLLKTIDLECEPDETDDEQKEETLKEETLKEETLKEETLKEETLKEETLKEETLKEEVKPVSKTMTKRPRGPRGPPRRPVPVKNEDDEDDSSDSAD